MLVLACMRGGFRVVSFTEGNVAQTLLHYTKHESEALAYGVDWLCKSAQVACCSFYDHNCSVFSYA